MFASIKYAILCGFLTSYVVPKFRLCDPCQVDMYTLCIGYSCRVNTLC